MVDFDCFLVILSPNKQNVRYEEKDNDGIACHSVGIDN